MHQSTVCRSAALMGEQFELQPWRGTGVLGYGCNESLELLRLSCRAHRLMDGQLQVATDPLHQPLLEPLWLLLPEGRVRSSGEARYLIRILRLRLARVGEELLGAGELVEVEDDPVDRQTCQAVSGRPACQNYAPSA